MGIEGPRIFTKTMKSESWVLNKNDYAGVVGTSIGTVNAIYARGELVAVMDLARTDGYYNPENRFYDRSIRRLLETHCTLLFEQSGPELQTTYASFLIREASKEMDRRLLEGV